MTTNRWFILGLLSFFSCASTKGAAVDLHEMTAAEHDRAAAKEEALATSRKDLFRPRAGLSLGSCDRSVASAEADRAVAASYPCLSASANPTAKYLAEAKRHRADAAAHRAASQVLREAEARACAGIADEDRELSPLEHCEDIVAIEPLYRKVSGHVGQRLAGATVFFRVLGGSGAWLSRVVGCHMARNAVLGVDPHEAPQCPLELKDVTAQVLQTWDGVALEIRSDSSEVAEEILRRATAFAACPSNEEEQEGEAPDPEHDSDERTW
jgi:hypothetical protein